jgi:hypothetical protein
MPAARGVKLSPAGHVYALGNFSNAPYDNTDMAYFDGATWEIQDVRWQANGDPYPVEPQPDISIDATETLVDFGAGSYVGSAMYSECILRSGDTIGNANATDMRFFTATTGLYLMGEFNDVVQPDGTNLNVATIARWNGQQWNALGNGIHDAYTGVYAQSEAPDSSIYFVGSFDSAGNLASHGLARWKGAGLSSVLIPSGDTFTLLCDGPNSFSVKLPSDMSMNLEAFDILGRPILTYSKLDLSAGNYQFNFPVTFSGPAFIIARGKNEVQSLKMMILPN